MSTTASRTSSIRWASCTRESAKRILPGQAWASMARSRHAIRNFWRTSTSGGRNETRRRTRMKHIRAVNQKAAKIEEYVASAGDDVFALQEGGEGAPHKRPHYPMGCSLVFA